MIVVTGATGNIGRPLVRALADAGEQVTAVARRQAATPVPFRQADLLEPETLRPLLAGAEAFFLLTSGNFLATGKIEDVLAEVRRADVRKVVLLSSQGVGTKRHSPHIEEAVRESGLEWTILRPGSLATNAFQWADMVRAGRVVEAPFGDVGLPTADPADVAEVAAKVLREQGHEGKIYELTGPESISPRQQAEQIGAALGEQVRFQEQSRAEAKARMGSYMPERMVEITLDILEKPTEEEKKVSPEVENLLGRRPRKFEEWAKNNAKAFR